MVLYTLYAAESWTIKAADGRKLLAFEMRCYRRILKVCWKDRIHNEVIREKVNRCHTIVDVIKHRKLQPYSLFKLYATTV